MFMDSIGLSYSAGSYPMTLNPCSKSHPDNKTKLQGNILLKSKDNKSPHAVRTCINNPSVCVFCHTTPTSSNKHAPFICLYL